MGIIKTKLIFLFLLLVSFQLFAQINLSKVSVDVGLISNPQNEVGNKGKSYSLYPELHLGGNLFTEYFQWDAYLGLLE